MVLHLVLLHADDDVVIYCATLEKTSLSAGIWEAHTRKVTSNSLDIYSIHGDIRGRSCKKMYGLVWVTLCIHESVILAFISRAERKRGDNTKIKFGLNLFHNQQRYKR